MRVAECLQCGKKFYARSLATKYCSVLCFQKAQLEQVGKLDAERMKRHGEILDKKIGQSLKRAREWNL